MVTIKAKIMLLKTIALAVQMECRSEVYLSFEQEIVNNLLLINFNA